MQGVLTVLVSELQGVSRVQRIALPRVVMQVVHDLVTRYLEASPRNCVVLRS